MYFTCEDVELWSSWAACLSAATEIAAFIVWCLTNNNMVGVICIFAGIVFLVSLVLNTIAEKW